MAKAHKPGSFCTCRLLAVAATLSLSTLHDGTKRRLKCALLLLLLLKLLVLCMLPCQPAASARHCRQKGLCLLLQTNASMHGSAWRSRLACWIRG